MVLQTYCFQSLQIIDLGLIDYTKTFDFQKKIVSDMINGNIKHDTILILEHFSIFTLGKRGGRENIIVSENFLKSKDIQIVQTERGGSITYHGPGQIVLYPIINIEQRKIGAAKFVYILEEVMIRTAKDFGVTALRDERNHGVWVKQTQSYDKVQMVKSDCINSNFNCFSAKLGSIGLSVKHGISFHGLAFNVNLDLTPFSWINPCGMAGVCMTSLKNEINKEIDMAQVKIKILHHFKTLV